MNKLRKFCIMCYSITYDDRLCEYCKEERRIKNSKKFNYREEVFKKEGEV